MIQSSSYKLYLTLAIVLTLVVLWFTVPIAIPHSVSAYGRIAAAREWLLARGSDGQLVVTLRNNTTGAAESYTVLQASTEGLISLTLDSAIVSRGRVAFGDTVGIVHSSEIEEQLINLKGQLNLARANLAAISSGEKPSTIAVAMLTEERTAAAASQQKKIVDRLQVLRQSDMVSQEEFDIAEGELALLELDHSLATASLREARSGAKQEDLDVILAEIDGLETEITALERRQASLTIMAPFAGTITRSQATDTVLIIYDDSERLALMALKWHDSRAVSQSQSVVVDWRALEYSGSAHLYRLEPLVQILNGEQVAYASASILKDEAPPPGTVIQCELQCGTISLTEFTQHILTSAGVL